MVRRAAISSCAGRVRKIEDAALAQHHVEIELARQTLIEPEREIVEGDRLGIEVVRSHDGGVAAGVAAAEPALLDHADACALVSLGKVIGGRQSMSAAADDDEVVGRLGLRLAPRLRPALMAGEALAKESESRIAAAHARIALPAGSYGEGAMTRALRSAPTICTLSSEPISAASGVTRAIARLFPTVWP